MTLSDEKASTREAKVRRLFAAFERDSLRTCVWKSADRWQDGIAGKTDIDLLVAQDQMAKAADCLIREGWIPAQAESWRSFPDVLDFVAFEQCESLHLHLHGRIVSGEKMVKSLRAPLTALYLRHTSPGSYPAFVRPELEFILLLVRMTLKVSLIDVAGAIKRRSRIALYRNYVAEYEDLRRKCNRREIADLLQEPELRILPADIILAAYDNLASLDVAGRRAIRRSISSWREIGWPGIRLRTFWRNLLKRWQGVGKTLPFPGLSIAVCGPDGSGKTTLVTALRKKLSRQIRTRSFYMGGNMRQPGPLRGVVMRSIWFPYLVTRKAFKIVGWRSAVSCIEVLYSCLNSSLMRAEKMRRLASARKAIARGEIALFERFPLFYPHGDDMPDSLHNGGTGQERGPDLLVLLDVAEDVAIARRPDDNHDILRKKIAAFQQFGAAPNLPDTEAIVLDANSPVAASLSAILDRVTSRLSAMAQAKRTAEEHP